MKTASPLGIDHVVVLVSDLETATAKWREDGFTITPGGVHTGGLTRNALVCFRDGSYVELLAFCSPNASASEHRWARYIGFWGPIDYAIAVSDLDAFASTLRAKSLPYTEPAEGGRERPDGVQLRWRGVFPTDQGRGLPFFIEDLTPRELRVPLSDDNTLHDNAASGIAQVRISVPRLEAVEDDFEALFGDSTESGNAISFKLQGSTLSVSQPADGSPEARFMNQRGPGLIAVTIAAPQPIVIKPTALQQRDL